MLPPRHRMRSGTDFSRTVRSGSRGSSRHVVVHLLLDPPTAATDPADDPIPTPAEPARVGFVVSKAVGGSVQRNLVKRRLRELVRERLHELPDGSLAVVRAQPSARGASFGELRDAVVRSIEVASSRERRARTADPTTGPRP